MFINIMQKKNNYNNNKYNNIVIQIYFGVVINSAELQLFLFECWISGCLKSLEEPH